LRLTLQGLDLMKGHRCDGLGGAHQARNRVAHGQPAKIGQGEERVRADDRGEILLELGEPLGGCGAAGRCDRVKAGPTTSSAE
jgi:hypothetical protein